ncbi:MAG: DUF501 domain-containing protein [Planctomycetota bacterium]
MNRCSLRYSPDDQAYVTGCLGRTPRGVVGVAARRPTGEPTVIINLPLQPKGKSWQPFPTLYWLVDAELNTAIAEIERKGGVRAIEKTVANDTRLLAAHRRDNVFYAMARWAVLNHKERLAANELGMSEMLEHSGVGGVGNHDAIKCLHAQYAFHLARRDTGTTVGQLMQEQFAMQPA